jgi:hypothetical protein
MANWTLVGGPVCGTIVTMEAAPTTRTETTGTQVKPRDLTGGLLLFVAVAQIVPGLVAFVAPGGFYDTFAPYPPENHHVLRDVGSWQIALGLAALVAVRRTSWRVPMLAILTVQYGLHTISHLIDVGNSDPSWNGPVELALLAGATVIVGAFFFRERSR